MEGLTSLLAIVMVQAAYGPPAPSAPPAAPRQVAAAAGSDGNAPADFDALLRAQGLSAAGQAALRGLPLPRGARGATEAAQCTVAQLAKRDPIPLDELRAAMEERDATAATQAQDTTGYLLAALPRLTAADQRILLAVVGTGPIGSGPPPRMPERRSAMAQRSGGPGGRGPGGGAMPPGGPMRNGPPPGGLGAGGMPPDGPPPGGPPIGPASACEALLGG